MPGCAGAGTTPQRVSTAVTVRAGTLQYNSRNVQRDESGTGRDESADGLADPPIGMGETLARGRTLAWPRRWLPRVVGSAGDGRDGV